MDPKVPKRDAGQIFEEMCRNEKTRNKEQVK